MKDINIVIKGAFRKEVKANKVQIEEDVLRMRIGLKPQEQDGE